MHVRRHGQLHQLSIFAPVSWVAYGPRGGYMLVILTCGGWSSPEQECFTGFCLYRLTTQKAYTDLFVATVTIVLLDRRRTERACGPGRQPTARRPREARQCQADQVTVVRVGRLLESGWGQAAVCVGRAWGQEGLRAVSTPPQSAAGRSLPDPLSSGRGGGAHHDQCLVLLVGAPGEDRSCPPAGGVLHADDHHRGVGQSCGTRPRR
jgi:hypothetical protein